MDHVKRNPTTRTLREVRYNDKELEDLARTLKQEATATGTAVLFAGPAGTGKTMAAEAVARGLGADLLRVNLREVVSKYIGETEKNLDRVFSDAQRTGTVLFFDEADALFGSRSDVKDAHDRFANQEVSYLIERIEAYAGLVLLAVNDPEAPREVASRLRRARTVIVR
jgi:SpoVK/Ycf46/Vps4 family AAA+-type ATPase